MNERIMTSNKAEEILAALRKKDRHNRKHWVPYDGQPDFSFAVLNAPKKELEEKDDRPEEGNG